MNRLASIIIPTYNSRAWVEEAVDSALSQTYPAVEVVVADDGSTDGTPELCRTFGSKVRVVQQPNCGRGSARNAGLAHARGEYLAFLDSDDVLLPTSVAKRVELLDAEPKVGWVCTDAMEFDETGNLGTFLSHFPWLDFDGDQFGQLLRACYPLTSTVMIRRSLVDSWGSFDPALRYGEDLEYFMRLLLVSRIACVPEVLTRRRIHSSQAVSSTFDRWNSRVQIYENFLDSQDQLPKTQRIQVKRSLKHASFKLGECYWQDYNKRMLRHNFVASLGLNEWALRALVYLFVSLAPLSVMVVARRFRHGS